MEHPYPVGTRIKTTPWFSQYSQIPKGTDGVILSGGRFGRGPTGEHYYYIARLKGYEKMPYSRTHTFQLDDLSFELAEKSAPVLLVTEG